MKHLISTISLYILSILCFTGKSNGETISGERFPQQYKNNFAIAYEVNPDIPKGLLEALAYTQSRMYHIYPEKTQVSCIGLPGAYGLMGLVEEGKGYFNNNLLQISRMSKIAVEDIKTDPQQHILAYAISFQKTYQKNQGDILKSLLLLSELPVKREQKLSDNYAAASFLYSVLYYMNDVHFQEAYDLPKHKFDLEKLFGKELYKRLRSPQIRITKPEEDSCSSFAAKTTGGTACSMPDGPAQFSAALWEAANSNNYSGSIDPFTIAIHTIQGSYSSAISWFQNPNASVSAHYVVRSFDGQVTQMVCHKRKAWHLGTENPNAVGIEHEGYVENGLTWYSNAMYESSAALSRFICEEEGINSLQTYDQPGTDGLKVLQHQCHKVKGHQHFPNQSHTDPGPDWDWERYYLLINPVPETDEILTASSSIFYDSGGADNNYGNEEHKTFLVQPANAKTVTMTFEEWEVEDGWDYLWIYDGTDETDALIGKYSGTSPGTVIGTTGSLFFEFRSDCADTKKGWKATYNSSSNSPDCPAPTNLYEDNIFPMGATLHWDDMQAEDYKIQYKRLYDFGDEWTTVYTPDNYLKLSGLAANAIYKWQVKQKCGEDNTSVYAGGKFQTTAVSYNFTSSQHYLVSACEGTFTDSGGTEASYGHQEDWTYTIHPSNAQKISVEFISFNIEKDYDFLYVYDGMDINAPLIGKYSGTNSPSTLIANSGAITFRFTSDNATYAFGWKATWTCEQEAQPCKPETYIQALSEWQNKDFSVQFTDDVVNCNTGNNSIAKRFYIVEEKLGSENQWRAKGNKGFFNDDFVSNSIHSDWHNISGNWTMENNHLVQFDEANSNTNLSVTVEQNNQQSYLYHWRAKMEGNGNNRRSGIHFFCDDMQKENRGNSYFVYFRADENKVQIYKVTDDMYALKTNDVANIQAGQWQDYKILYDNNSGNIKVFVDDVMVSEWTDDNPHTNGQFISLRTGNVKTHFDFIRVYRERNTWVDISVGQNKDIEVQSTNSNETAAQIRTLILSNEDIWSEIAATQIKIDYTAPEPFMIEQAQIIQQNNSTFFLNVKWDASSDPHSGLKYYAYTLGTKAGLADVIDYTVLNANATELQATISGLNENQAYYLSLLAKNKAGLVTTGTSSLTTNGIMTGIKDKQAEPVSPFQLYPNPAKDVLYIDYDIFQSAPATIMVYDLLGREIKRQTLVTQYGHNHHSLDISTLQKGLYFLVIQGGTTEYKGRFLVEE